MAHTIVHRVALTWVGSLSEAYKFRRTMDLNLITFLIYSLRGCLQSFFPRCEKIALMSSKAH